MSVDLRSPNQLSISIMCLGQMSVGQMPTWIYFLAKCLSDKFILAKMFISQRAVDQMSVNPMSFDQMCVGQLSVEQLPIDKMSVIQVFFYQNS
jgi:hypothetical protein